MFEKKYSQIEKEDTRGSEIFVVVWDVLYISEQP